MMKGLLLLLSLLPASTAFAGPERLRETFRAYTEKRRAEESLRLPPLPETETQGKIERPAPSPSSESPAPPPRAEKAVADLLALSKSFPEARDWDPLQWQAMAEWFGAPTQEAFLKKVFTQNQGALPALTGRVVWVNDPFARVLPEEDDRQAEAWRRQALRQLKAEGFSLEEIDPPPYPRFDDQAEDLHLALVRKAREGPFLLASSGDASALLLRSLDLNPALLRAPEIRGWVNLNGRLFGPQDLPPVRGPASASPADQPLSEARREILFLRRERLGPQAPLGARFPVLNLVVTGGRFRPGPNLRESLVPRASTLFLESGGGLEAVKAALPWLGQPRSAGGKVVSSP